MGEQAATRLSESNAPPPFSEIFKVVQTVLCAAGQSFSPGTLTYPELVEALGGEEIFGVPFQNWAMEQILDYILGFKHYSEDILRSRGISRIAARQRKKEAIDTWLCNVGLDNGDTIQVEIRLVGRELWVRSHVLFSAVQEVPIGAASQQLLF